MKTCPECGNQFYDSKHKDKVYCSRACYDKALFNFAKTTCEVCGIEFVAKKRSNRVARFCSWECRIKSKDKIVKCPQCGKEERVPTGHKKKFCSSACANRYNQKPDPAKRKIYTCEWCNKEFEEWTYRNTKLCSSQCRSEYGASVRAKQLYKPGTQKTRGLNWKKQAKLARKRDNYTCQVCGKHGWLDKFRVQVHHIVPYRLFNDDYEKANDLNNLISLCPSCHPKVESGVVQLPRH